MGQKQMKLAVLMGDHNNDVFFNKKMYGRFSGWPKKVTVKMKRPYYPRDCKARFHCICFAIAFLFEKNTASGGEHFVELVSGSSLIVQGAFIQFASQGTQSSHHSLRAGYSEMYSAGASDQETKRRRPS